MTSLKKKIYFNLSIIILALLSASSSCQKKKENKNTSTLFPNNDSELALLMREITNDAENIKNLIVKEKEIKSSIQFVDPLLLKQQLKSQ